MRLVALALALILRPWSLTPDPWPSPDPWALIPGPCSFYPSWHLGHQYVDLACGPCFRREMGVPQRRHGLPPRPYTHRRADGSDRPVVRRRPV